MTNQEILDNAPEGAEDWTHYWEGLYIRWVDGLFLNFEPNCPELTRCKEWCADLDIDDCCEIRSRTDIERIVELEKEVSRLNSCFKK